MGLSFFQKLQRRNRDFQLDVDGISLPVRVTENDRAKRLILRIAPGGSSLKVTAPHHIGDDEIEAFVEKNRSWVAARLGRMPARMIIEEGSTIPYRGIDHKIVSSGKLRGLVESRTQDDMPTLIVPGEGDTIRRKLVGWLKQEARRELDAAVMRHCEQIGVRPKRLRITDTTSRWGSCSSTRTLSFSWRIIMAPPEILDYLAAHEVAHLVEMNHSKKFWALTRRLCPETDKHKSWLRVHGARLHAVDI